ncbi:TIR domain-containing protein [Sphingopyxis sp. 550A]
MEEAKRPKLFVSHHSSKYDVALHVEKALARHGVDCWIAPRDVGPGEAFDTAIMQAIRDSAGVLLLFCSQSDKSPHVKRELILADSAHKAIIPLRLEEIVPDDLAYHLASAQWIDWLEKRDDSIARIAAKAHQLAGTLAPDRTEPAVAAPAAAAAADNLHAAILTQASAPEPAASSGGSAKTLMIGALLVLVAVLGAMLFLRGGEEKKAELATAAAPAAASPAATAPGPATAAPAATMPTAPAETMATAKIPPSFNCKYAATRAEKLICGDDELAALDRELNRAYKQLDRTAGPLREQIAAEQRGWRIGQRDTCGDAACVADAMRQRIIVLDSQRASLGNEEGQ